MSNVLLISLNNQYELITSSYLITSYRQNNPQASISILTFSHLEKEAKMLKGIENVYTIDLNKIKQIYQNKLFSNGLALDSFYESIHELGSKKWDTVINHSNNLLTSYIASYIDCEETFGTKFSETGSGIYNNQWAKYESSIAPTQGRLAIHSVYTRHNILDIPFEKNKRRLNVSEDYIAIAKQNIDRIKLTKASSDDVKIIALSLMCDKNGNRADLQTLSNLIEVYESSQNFKPVLLISGTDEEKLIVNKLNEQFNNQLISINADYTAMTSLLYCIDMLVSVPSLHLFVADALNKKIIEVQVNQNITTPSIVNSDNFVVYQACERAIFDEILMLTNSIYGETLPVESIENQTQTYQSIDDERWNYFTQVSGKIDITSELDYHLSRSFCLEVMGEERNLELLTNIRENSGPQLSEYITKNKESLTLIVKSLLSTLRSLKGMKQSKENRVKFVDYLDTLIQVGESHPVVSSAITLFQTDIDNHSVSSTEDNAKFIERRLFTLKNDLQKAASLLDYLAQADHSTVEVPKSSESSL